MADRAGHSGRCQRCAEQFEQVVGGGHQRPFPVHLLQTSQTESTQTTGTLDLIKDQLDDHLAQGVDRLAGLGSELPIHPPTCIEASGFITPCWAGPLAVLVATGGDVGVELPALTGFQVGCAAVTGVRDQRSKPLTSIGLNALKHGQQVHRITGLLA